MNSTFERTASRRQAASGAVLLVWLVLLLVPALGAAQGVYPLPEPLPALNLRVTGTIYAIAPYGDGYVLGGQFDRINGEPRRNIALIGPDGALEDDGFEWIDGGSNAIIHNLVVDGDALYAVGDFTQVNGAARQYVAKLSLIDGSLDPGFAPVPNAPVRALATDGAGGVFLGGDFSAVNGTARDNSAKVDSSGALTSWKAGYKDASVVHAIGYDHVSGQVYVGGNLRLGGLHRAVARLDGVSGAADPSWKLKVNPRGTPQIFAITLSDDHVYLGGRFTRFDNINRANIARVGRNDGEIDAAWNPGANSAVRSILLDGDGIIVGGDFTRIGGSDHLRLARIAANGLADPAFVVNADRPVRALIADASGLLVGGAFRTINGSPEEGLARLVNYASDPSFVGTVGGPGQVDAFAFDSDGGVFVGGVFDFIDEGGSIHARSNLLRLDSNFALDTGWVLDIASDVQALAFNASSDSLYVGGSFPARLQRYDVSGASPVLDGGWNVAADGAVNGLALDAAGLLYAIGEFTSIGGSPRNGVARLNGDNADGWNPAPDGRVDTIALGAGSVWLGGDCLLVAGNECSSNLVRSNTTTGAIDSGFDAETDGAVSALLVEGTDLYLGGAFASVQGAARASLARIDTGTGDVDAEWAPSTSGRVGALALDAANGWIYAGGFFASAGADAHPNMARASISDPGVVDPGWRPGSDDALEQMAVVGSAGDVFVAGRFRSVTNLPRGGVARLITDGSDATAIAITSIAPTPSMTGEQYTIAFAVTNLTDEATAPVGNVLVGTDHGEFCGPIAVDASGLGSCAITSTSSGLRQVIAAFGGSAPFLDSLSAPVAHQVFAAVDVNHVDTRIEATDPAAAADGIDAGAVRVTLVDGAGSPVSDVAISFVGTGSAILASANGVTDASGQFSTTLTDVVQELVEVTALYDVDGDGTAETAVVNGSPAVVGFFGTVDPTQLSTRIDATDPSAAADGSDTGEVTVTLVDDLGIPVQGIAVSFSNSGSAILAASSGTTDGLGQFRTTLTDTVAEFVTVTAQYDSDNSGSADAAVDNGSPAGVLFHGPVDPTQLATRIDATDPLAAADGIDTAMVTVSLVDSNGNPVPDVAVSFSPGAGSASLLTLGVSNAAGQVDALLTDTVPELVEVTALFDSDGDGIPDHAVDNGSPATVAFFGEVDPAHLSTRIDAVDPSAAADGIDSAAVTVSLVDSNGTPVEGVAVSFSSSGSAVLGAAGGLSGASGEVSTTLTDLVAENVAVNALYDSDDDGTADAAVANGAPANVVFFGAVDPGPEGATSIETLDGTAVADGIDAGVVRVTLADANGLPVSGVVVGFSASSVGAVFGNPSGSTDAAGQVSTTLTSVVAGAVQVTAQYDADGNGSPDTLVANGSPATVTFVAGPVDPSPGGSTLIAALDDTAFADGIDTGAVSVTLADAHGNPVAGVAVSLATSGSAVLANASGLTDAGGQFGSTLVDSVVEIAGVTAMFDASGDGIPETAIVNGSPANVTFLAEQSTSIAITGHAPDPSVVGQSYTVSFQVTTAGAAVGTVVVGDGAGASCNVTLAAEANGAASCEIASTSAGAHTLTASFAGGTGFGDSVSGGETHTVDAAATAMSLSGPSILTEGDFANFTWSVSVVAPGAGVPEGNVSISDGGILSCTAAVAAGGCSIQIDVAGAYDFSASYPGNADFLGSVAGPVAVDVQAGGVPVTDIAVRHEIVASGILSDGSGDLVDYEFEVANIGTTDQTGIAIEMLMPPEFADISWTCTPSAAGASCGEAAGTGDIAFTVDLAAGTNVLIELAVRIVDPEDNGVETAATAAVAVGEIDPSNNAATTFYRSCSTSEVIGDRPLPAHLCGFRDGFEGTAVVVE